MTSETTNCHAVSKCKKVFTFNVIVKIETTQTFEQTFSVAKQWHEPLYNSSQNYQDLM